MRIGSIVLAAAAAAVTVACTPEVQEHDSPPATLQPPVTQTPQFDSIAAAAGRPAGTPGDTGEVGPRPQGDPRENFQLVDSAAPVRN